MENLVLTPVSVYESIEGVYISRGDHSLVSLKGKDAPMIAHTISAFQENIIPDEAFELLRAKYGIDQNYFNKLTKWLIQQKILTHPTKNHQKEVRTIGIIGQFSSEKDLVESFEILNRGEQNTFSFENVNYINLNSFNEANISLPDADLYLYFSPIFEHYQKLKVLNKQLYDQKIRCMHVGIDKHSYELGPFVIPELKTPCMGCYAKRKLINMANPEEYQKFISLLPVEQLNNYSISSIKHYKLMLEHLGITLQEYFTTQTSDLTGRTLHVDLYDYNTRVSRLLKVPTCEICCESEKNLFVPFN
jgi:hypothetical protein